MNTNLTLLLAALLLGLSKGGLGGPVPGALVAPLLSSAMPVSQAVGLTLPLFMLGDAFALPVYWRKWEARHIRLMLPAAVVGIVMGILLLATLPDLVLRRLLGLFSLVAVLYKLASDSLPRLAYQPRDWHGYLAGWASGFSSALANAGAPPFTAYLLLQRVTPTAFIGTSILFFALVNLVKLPGFLAAHVLDLRQLLEVAWVVPVIPLGVWLGRRALLWIDAQTFERFMLFLLFLAALSLLLG